MLPIAQVHRWATVVPPDEAAAGLLLAVATITLLAGLLRNPRECVRIVPGILFLMAGASVIWLASKPAIAHLEPAGVGALGALALVLHIILHRNSGPAPCARSASSVSWFYLGGALVLSGAFLFDDLAGYGGVMVGWEPTVIGGFATAYESGDGVLDFTRARFLWDDGTLSGGHTSLFYGAPTYALFHLLGFSAWTLRAASAVAVLLSAAVAYGLGRRFFGDVVGAALAILLALNPALLFYGRYGSSPAATLLAVLLAIYFTWRFVEEDRSAWWMGFLAGAALVLATFQYAPARVMVLLLLGFVGLVTVWRWRRLSWRRGVGLLVILGITFGTWAFQKSMLRDGFLLSARGEHFFAFLDNPATVESLLGRELTVRNGVTAAITPGEKVDVLHATLRTTLPQYVDLVLPDLRPMPGGVVNEIDPPPLPLYYAPLIVLILLGVARSVTHPAAPHVCLLILVAGSTVPLLLTNRVDAHRMMLFVIPFSIWGALGVGEVARMMSRARVPRIVQHLFALASIAAVFGNDIYLLCYGPGQTPEPRAARVLNEEIAQIPTPVVVAWRWAARDIGPTRLFLLERMRTEPGWRGTMVSERLQEGLRVDGQLPTERTVQMLQDLLRSVTLVMAPAEPYRAFAAALEGRGVDVAERGDEATPFLRLAADPTVPLPSFLPKRLHTAPRLIEPTPIALEPGFSATRLELRGVDCPFAAPKINRSWNGERIKMGGVTHQLGLGTHATCRITYTVPSGATRFRAIVGLSDSIKGCEQASVTFELHDQNGSRLYDSGLVDKRSPPLLAEVDVRNLAEITLVVTDAKDGIACDHANWADPVFLPREGAGRSVPVPRRGAE